MKHLIIFLCTFFVITYTSAQNLLTKPKDVERIKSSKIIIAQYDNEKLSEDFEAAVRSFWKFTPIEGAMPEKEALAKAKSDGTYLVIRLGNVVVRRNHTNMSTGITYKTLNYGKSLELNDGKKTVVSNFIPMYKDDTHGKEIFMFGVSLLQNNLSNMDIKQIGMTKVNKYYNENASDIKDKVLLIPDGWADEKLSEEIVSSLYPYKAEIVSYEVWSDAINNRKEGKAYVIVVPVPVSDKYVYYHYLMDCEKGSVYTISVTKVAFHAQGVNLSKGNSGYINDKNIKKYSEAVAK